MAKAVSKTGRVIAFEPIPQNIEHLHTNLYLNNIQNVSTTQCALGDTNDLIYLTDLHTSKDHSTGFFHFTEDENQGFSVEQILLGDALNNELDKQAPVRLLKIDVEGMEERVLIGLGEWLQPQRIQAILFETFIGPEGFSAPSQSVLIILRNHGYDICEIQSSGQLSSSVRIDEETRRRTTTLNLVAVAPEVAQ
jgi:FkbM family methyltransferase